MITTIIMANEIPNFTFESMLFFCKWYVLIITNRQKTYVTCGFCKIIVTLTRKGYFHYSVPHSSFISIQMKIMQFKNTIQLNYLFSISCSCLNPHFSLTLSSSFAKITLSNIIPNAKIVIIDAII